MPATPRVILLEKKAKPFFARHPWVFPSAIDRVEGAPDVGAVVRVVSSERKFVAWGLFNGSSSIRIRLYSWDEATPIDEALFVRRLERAMETRQKMPGLAEPRAGCRLVHSEADELSGLVVDRFADVLHVQQHAAALIPFEPVILATLERILKPTSILVTRDPRIAELEGVAAEDRVGFGTPPDGPVMVRENGLVFEVDPRGGQKTGMFLDQRENRARVAAHAKGRELLDLFCYGGGFGITAVKLGGARAALGVDSSGPAIALAQRNAEHNDLTSVEFLHGDVNPTLERLLKEKRRFGLVVCDPPKFARGSGGVTGALKGYEFVNRLALQTVEPGGALATFSCSGHVSREQFLEALTEAAWKANRLVQVLEPLGQPGDHPISLRCRETEYLKGFLLRVTEPIG